MRRKEVIKAIELVRLDTTDVGERARLMGMLHFQSAVGHMAPVPMGVVFGQSMRCAWLIVRRLGAVDAERARRFRQREHHLATVWILIAYIVLLGLCVWVVAIVLAVSSPSSSVLTIMWSLLALIGLGSYVFVLRMMVRPKLMAKAQVGRKTKNLNQAMMHDERFQAWCVGCGYELRGLESALGDELWVGPVVCPECGQGYPAIGE